ncbi:MAG TPA: MFS transporter [Xanthobacteraceae bacterium]|jgi:PPP family 3-phenylpropionic acid transporter|nr:MFS transporter [Xanthobacteraceae bacterium]
MHESPANTAKTLNAARAPISAAGGYLAACVALGIQAPFFPLFLADRGFSADAISLALALPMAIRLAAMPLAGIISDRLAAPRLVLVALGFGGAAGFMLVGLAAGIIPIMLAIGLAAVFWTPIFPLLDAYALRLAAARAIDYGRVRLWGSVSFIATNVAAGYLLNRLPISLVVWVIAGGILLFAFSAWALPLLTRPAPHERKQRIGRPAKALWLGVLAAACVQASHGLFYGFSALDWHSKGVAPGTIGVLWAIGTGAEIVLFYFGTQVTARVAPLALIALGGLAAVLRFGAFAFDLAPLTIAVLQLLHAFTFGATHLGLMALLGLHVPAHSSGRSQAYSSTILGVVMACATLMAGPLYSHWNVAAYAVYALLGGIGGAIALAAYLQPHSSGAGGKTRALS